MLRLHSTFLMLSSVTDGGVQEGEFLVAVASRIVWAYGVISVLVTAISDPVSLDIRIDLQADPGVSILACIC